MSIVWTEEQDLLRQSLSRFLSEKYAADKRREIISSTEGWSAEIWSQLAEMGVMAVAFPEECGGLGGTAADIYAVMEEFGKSLLVEPYLSSTIVCGRLLQNAGGATSETLIAELIAGDLVLALGYTEPKSRFDLSYVETTATRDGDRFVLNGQKSVVIGAPIAGKLIISARTSGAAGDRDGVSLFVLDANAPGVRIQTYPTIDGMRAGEVFLDTVSVPADCLIGEADNAAPVIEAAIDAGILAACAEASGICHVMCELTTEYCKTRQQFGRPIAEFQSLQHVMADMFIASEELEATGQMAARRVDGRDEDAAAYLSAAKVQLGKSCKFVGEAAIQLHGAMGMTDEMEVGQFFKRATVLCQLFGNGDYHLERYRALTEKATA